MLESWIWLPTTRMQQDCADVTGENSRWGWLAAYTVHSTVDSTKASWLFGPFNHHGGRRVIYDNRRPSVQRQLVKSLFVCNPASPASAHNMTSPIACYSRRIFIFVSFCGHSDGRGWLIDCCFTARQHSANCGGRKPTQLARDGQRDTMHNTLRYAIIMYGRGER